VAKLAVAHGGRRTVEGADHVRSHRRSSASGDGSAVAAWVRWSTPVRTGNAAFAQRQLDVFGEVMDALHLARRAGLEPDADAWRLQRALLEFLEAAWPEPDEGIWEVRGPRRHFTHSKVMAWVAFDRGLKAIERSGLDGPLERWREHRRRLHGFLHRYPTSPAGEIDGLPAGEGVFLPGTFWLADNHLLRGRRREAQQVFERLLAVANDVGLLAEEYDPVNKRLLGNFPQAFSHVSLINTARKLARESGPAEDRKEA